MTKTEQMRKELQKLLRKGKEENPYLWATHLIRFSFNEEETVFLTCLSDQVETAFDFLSNNEPDFILIEELGRVSMTYNWPMKNN